MAIPIFDTMTPSDIERFWSKVDRSGGPTACWPWTAGSRGRGYGAFKLAGKIVDSHRVSWALANGRDPAPGLDVAHAPVVCHNRGCCNDLHLREATRSENMKDAVADGTLRMPAGFLAELERKRAATHCPRGHPYEGDNLYRSPSGRRKCKTCDRELQSERRAKRAVVV